MGSLTNNFLSGVASQDLCCTEIGYFQREEASSVTNRARTQEAEDRYVWHDPPTILATFGFLIDIIPLLGTERRMSSLPGKTHTRKQSLRQLDKIQSQMNQLREQKQQLLTRASASTPSSPRGPVNTNTNNKEEAKSTPASPTSDMMSPRRSSMILNTNQDVASFLSALITQNGSIDDVDEYLASPRSEVSSNDGMDDDYDWAQDDDSEDEISSASSSTVGTDSPNSPRIFYNDNVDVPKLVDECYQLVVDGKLSEVPTILEKENVSPEKLTIIYDLLDTKLEKLAAETEAK